LRIFFNVYIVTLSSKDQKLDGDDPVHLKWLFETASKRADEFNISGVTYSLAQGVVKNIIPAIASTNAIIAGIIISPFLMKILKNSNTASCANEAFKLATSCAKTMSNYMMYVGDDGIYTHTFELEKKDDCQVCGSESLKLTISPKWTLENLIESLSDRPELLLKAPSLRTASTSLYMRAPVFLEEATRPNLVRLVRDLVKDGETITVTDQALPFNLNVILTFEKIN
jgi:NEDD8-activating enzyme E1